MIPVVDGDVATCFDAARGISKVKIQNRGVCLVGISLAGGVITGPGARKVKALNSKVSIIGDSVAPHGDNLHSAAVFTTPTITKVLVR